MVRFVGFVGILFSVWLLAGSIPAQETPAIFVNWLALAGGRGYSESEIRPGACLIGPTVVNCYVSGTSVFLIARKEHTIR